MKGWRRAFALLFALGLIAVPSTVAAGKLTERLQSTLRYSGAGDQVGIWVQFADKGSRDLLKAAIPKDVVSERALFRRLTVLPPDRAVDYADLPIDEGYVRIVAAHGATIRQRSRWFNAVSAIATPEQIQQLAAIPFVSEIDLIGRYRNDRTVEQPRELSPGETHTPLLKTDSPNALDYGGSLAQVSLLNIPAVHNAGNAAEGIIIGVFDNGFRLPGHQAFDSLKIVGTRDFVDHKTSVVPNNPSLSFGDHGINTLSTIGGFKPGSLIGPAFRAKYILARTENDSSETPFEEDNWVAAIEWAESLGVQVTSTSLGYLLYDLPYASWSWQDMNGRTTKITRAAAEAVRKGVIVVNSAGNNGIGPDTSRNTLNAPADAESVLTVGAVTPSGLRASFSSVGPTTSIPPHIKPDVMATGTSIVAASASNPAGYTQIQGTSFSCPLAAGVAALVLKAHPAATAMQVIDALKMTASRASTPGNRFGWGIIDAVKAVNYLTPSDTGGPPALPSAYQLEQNFPNPFNPKTVIAYNLAEASGVTLRIYDILGREVKTLVNATQPRGRYLPTWDGSNDEGGAASSGVYFYRLVALGASGTSRTITRKMMMIK
jgi:subtilisin family serine protease